MKNNRPSAPKGTARRLLGYTGQKKGMLFVIALCALVASTLDIIFPFFVGTAIDSILSPGNVNFAVIFQILCILAVMLLVQVLFARFMAYLSYAAASRIVAKLRREAFDHLSRLPLSYYDTHSHGDLTSRFVNDCEAIHEGLMQGFLQLFSGLVTIVGSLCFMLYMSWKITLVVLGVTGLTFVVAMVVTKLSNKYFRRQQALVGELSGIAGEMIGGLRVVKAYGYETRASRQFDEVNNRLYTDGQKAQFVSSLTNPTTRFVGHLAYIAVGVIGGIAGGLSAGRIMSFLSYSTQFSKPFSELTAVTTQIMAAFAASARIFELMDEAPESESPHPPKELKAPHGEVRFERVSFSYSKNRPLIRDFSAVAKPGMRVAIVGPTGAGKTTMVNLLMRFYDVDEGAILVDGTDIRSVTRDSLHRVFGMVLQDTWLFSGTVRENIAYGRPDATEEEVIAAAKAAHAHGFIKRLPKGYDTMLAEAGGNISQGQKQLLTIARVMLLDPVVLILDEATSSVDTLTEQRIQKAFLKMMQGRTSFVIAHRLSTIRDADLILYLQDGQILEQGSHAELLKQEGYYYNLYQSQFVKPGEAEG